jgi:hypothetical protein
MEEYEIHYIRQLRRPIDHTVLRQYLTQQNNLGIRSYQLPLHCSQQFVFTVALASVSHKRLTAWTSTGVVAATHSLRYAAWHDAARSATTGSSASGIVAASSSGAHAAAAFGSHFATAAAFSPDSTKNSHSCAAPVSPTWLQMLSSQFCTQSELRFCGGGCCCGCCGGGVGAVPFCVGEAPEPPAHRD